MSGQGPSQGQGRGRGESSRLTVAEATESRQRSQAGGDLPVLDVSPNRDSSGESSGSPTRAHRGRGAFRTTELHTMPSNITSLRSPNPAGTFVEVLSNFVRINPMKERQVYQYRIEFEPNVESVPLRRKLFMTTFKEILGGHPTFDGMSDVRASTKLPEKETKRGMVHPSDPQVTISMTVKLVGTVVWESFEMLRLYNMNMKQFLRDLGFFSVSTTGAYVHPALATPVRNDLTAIRGYRTSINIHRGPLKPDGVPMNEKGEILINLESVHKLMNIKSVRDLMMELRTQSRNFKEDIQAQLVGKLVVTNYNKEVYKIEDVNFSMNPSSTFTDRRANREISYIEYYKTRYDITVNDAHQPMLLVISNNRRKREDEPNKEVYLVPELCNIAGLTDQQRADNRLKIDLIRASQIPPQDRVQHLQTFLGQLHSNASVNELLRRWGYAYEREPVKIRARVIPTETIGYGRAVRQPPSSWPKVDLMGSFEQGVVRDSVARPPEFPKMHIVVPKSCAGNIENQITSSLRTAFSKLGLNPGGVEFTRMTQGDGAHTYVTSLRNIPEDCSAAIVILQSQNKERYDAVKKIASVERGLITQVLTARLMTDQRKAGGAAVKIGIQLAAKLGGEPWYINLPMKDAMVCGYDTHHDTANRGRSYGAFVASMNTTYSRWFSKADSHDKIDELSTHMTENLSTALTRYRELNRKSPVRVIIYRDGVGDGQIDHVFRVELEGIKKAIRDFDKSITLAFIIVNKRIGARFYLRGASGYLNPTPGTVIDDVVTRRERYDFYLISQSTRNGTVTPTYYNIIHDDTRLDPAKHQAMAFKMCFNYYNWTGTVRVPAPCQYAHKLALLCGEHLHAVPNATLDDRLHFL